MSICPQIPAAEVSPVGQHASSRLAELRPDLERLLTRGGAEPPLFTVSQIRCETVHMRTRDGVLLATDLYFPPLDQAPTIVVRTPYGRAIDAFVGAFLLFARRGYIVISQDCRGTGDSEPDDWDYYVYEPEDGCDLVDWISKQTWYNGFIASCGGSYLAQTQWCMAMHPCMSTIVPETSGLGFAINTVRLHMFLNAYARSVGKGSGQVAASSLDMEHRIREETMASGYFNEPLHRPCRAQLLERFPGLGTVSPHEAKKWLWEYYCSLSCAQRAKLLKEALGSDRITITGVESLPDIFGHGISHDAHTLPHADPSELCRSLHAPALMITGWYDWGLNDALATWQKFSREAKESVRMRSRLLITPSAHTAPGYHEGMAEHPELQRTYTTVNQVGLLLHWYAALREGRTDSWPTVIYYLMGANEWRAASDWPPPGVRMTSLYLGAGGTLTSEKPREDSAPSRYTYDPNDPTPTIGGSIVSSYYLPGRVDVSAVQKRTDVSTYTTLPLDRDIDVIGPLRLVLHVSSSAVDTDFAARLSDVFPDGRAIQLQNGVLRARYRHLYKEPELLVPGKIHELEIDMWATANRFKAGHRIRLDISSADFPRFDRNTNRGGNPGEPIRATQTIYHDMNNLSQLILPVCSS
jgi:uncharacterized protein